MHDTPTGIAIALPRAAISPLRHLGSWPDAAFAQRPTAAAPFASTAWPGGLEPVIVCPCRRRRDQPAAAGLVIGRLNKIIFHSVSDDDHVPRGKARDKITMERLQASPQDRPFTTKITRGPR